MSKLALATENPMESNPADVSKEQLISDFKVVMADAEALLKATASQSGEKLVEIRARVEESLSTAKDHMLEAQAALLEKSRLAAKVTDDYVHDHPWKAIGIATGIGVIVGLLIGRK